MWDDSTVAFEIGYPWYTRPPWYRGKRYHKSFITVWHVDPRGDRGSPCGAPYGTDPHRLWRSHVHHWQIQVHPWQHFKRWAFERCEHCGRGAPWGYCPVSHGKGWVHFECDAAISYKRRCADLEAMLRAAFAGYCRTTDMEPREALDILLPPRPDKDGSWYRNYTARQVLGVHTLDSEGAE
jgi:hypothetical protein